MDYRPRPIIRRARPTKAEIEAQHAALLQIIEEQKPMTVRQVFYQATVQGLIDKTELDYKNIGWALTVMRKTGKLPYEWIEDGSRTVLQPASFTSPADAVRVVAESYRKALWTDLDCTVSVWIEKDALTGVIYPVTAEFDVPLRAARGYSSLSFLHDAALDLDPAKGNFIFHLGDYDPSGVNAGEKIDETLRELAPAGTEIIFERLAVTPEQIEAWNLPTRPTKASDSRAASFESDVSVELDAIEPDQLRALVRKAIERHMPPKLFKKLKRIEERERAELAYIADYS
jgi:hypothetical protein